MSVRIGNKIVAGIPERALHGIGEIFTTTDTGVIAGAVEANGGSYNLADYNSGADSIASKLAAGSIAYVSKTEFQTRVANTDACDSFGWDGAGGTFYCWRINEPDGTGYTTSENPVVGDTVYYVSNNYTTTVAGIITQVGSNETGSYIMWTDSSTVHYRTPSKDKTKASDPTFLVPKLNPWHIGKSAPVVGNGMTLGLTNGTTSGGLVYNSTRELGAGTTGYGTNVGTTGIGISNFVDGTTMGISTDPTKSGIIADLSEAANLRVMVQLATGATDQALETCTSVLADVSGLKDMSNITATGKNTVVSWGMPDYSAVVSMTSGSAAPKNGWAVAYGVNANVLYSVNDVPVAQGNFYNGKWSGNWNLQIMVSAGDVVTGGSWNFIPCKGAN